VEGDGMKKPGDRRDFGLVIALLCAIKGWNQMRLSRESGIDNDLISDYWHGLKSPLRKTRERLAKAFGVEPSFLEQLVPCCRGIRIAFEGAVQDSPATAPAAGETDSRVEQQVAAAVLAAMAPIFLQLPRLERAPGPQAEDRAWAERVWSAMEPLAAEIQDMAAAVLLGDVRSWALSVRICEAGGASASQNAAEALRLARLALRIAREVPDALDAKWRLCLLGHCEPFEANALRVGGNLPAAREAFVRADKHCEQGEGGDPAGLLDGTRRLDLKASFLRVAGQTEQAFALLKQAWQGARSDRARGRLLIKKAVCLIVAGEYADSLTALEKAELLIAGEAEPRLIFACVFNRAVNACHLELYEEAARLLPRTEALAAAADLGTGLAGIRLLWLQGRTWAGLGRREEAIAALAEVREYFLTEKIAYDYALVSVELATLYLEQGRTGLVKDLAEEMLWIFKDQKVHQEALAALALFRHAAQAEEARVEWTRRLVKYLYKAQHNPRLRFAA
jgi:transcriptional regulator with XRE-family HTH domain